jgi:triosephosphate isomerase
LIYAGQLINLKKINESGSTGMRIPLVAGNWKMNGSLNSVRGLLEEFKAGIQGVKGVESAVLAPFVYLDEVERLLTGTDIKWGAQNLSEHPSGAFTGEISASMLLDFHCSYVIVGHSERRTLYGETSKLVAQKFVAARKAGQTPILCIGESLEERERGVTESVVSRQLESVLELAGIQGIGSSVIAYEPVWAIGTGKTATPSQAQEVHAFIRSKLAGEDTAIASRLRILYGGSVKGSNAAELFTMPDIDGGLIGGASLEAQEFLTIFKAAV